MSTRAGYPKTTSAINFRVASLTTCIGLAMLALASFATGCAGFNFSQAQKIQPPPSISFQPSQTGNQTQLMANSSDGNLGAAQGYNFAATQNNSNSQLRYQSPDDDIAPKRNPGSAAIPGRTVQTPPQVNPVVDQGNQAAMDVQNVIAEVVIKGNQVVPEHHITRNLRSRPGRYFDPDLLQQDVDQIWRMREIKRVNGPFIDNTTEGLVITIEVVEKQMLAGVEIIGNRGITDRAIKKHLGLDDGYPLDIHEIRSIKTRIEELYREKGYPRTQVEVLSGTEPEDEKVVFLVNEDSQQRIWNAEFQGNSIASDARLRHFIKSKPGILKVFGGLVKRDEVEQDVMRLINYYRELGFFSARIGREVVESDDGRWLTLRFIIDEGPRYQVRNVSFIGNKVFTAEQLAGIVELKPEQSAEPHFNAAKMNKDTANLRDLYGTYGFVFAQIECEPRFLETPGELDLVYRIEEGDPYRVGKINVHINGGNGVTKREVVLNRLSIRPGDLINIREIRNSERRLNSAQIFAGADPSTGGSPARIVVNPPVAQEWSKLVKENMRNTELR